jgi:hypothetical protein
VTQEQPSRDSWLRRHLRVEDVLLVAWLVVIEPVLFPVPSGSNRTNGPDLVFGLLDLLGLLAFVACLAARSQPGVVSGLVNRGELLYAVGPLFGAFAFAIDDTTEKLGLAGNAALLPIGAGVAVAILVRRLAPPLTADQRRALVTPFILLTSRFFGQFLSGLTDFFDLRQLAAAVANPADLAGTGFVLLIGVLAILIFYVMFVFAPRQVADREGTPRSWTIRFLLFVVSLSIGQTITGLLHGA